MAENNEPAAATGRESIDHIRELLVGNLVRTLGDQIDEIKVAVKRSESAARESIEELERKGARIAADQRDQALRQMEAISERLTQRLETLGSGLANRTNELDDRIGTAVQGVEQTEKRLREELGTRIEDILVQTREQVSKVAASASAKAGYLEGRLGQQRDAVAEELETIRRGFDKRLQQVQDEFKTASGALTEETRRALADAAETLQSELTEGFEQQNRRVNALKNEADEFERRLRGELDQKATDISGRINKRLDAMDTALNNRVQEVESRFAGVEKRLEDRIAQAMGMLESAQKEMRAAIDSLPGRIDERVRAIREDLDRRKADREDLGNMFIELGMRLRKQAGAPDILIHSGEGVSPLDILEAIASEASADTASGEGADPMRVSTQPASTGGSRNGSGR